jgi:nucleoside-diphosphate-sugar epimerase
MPSPRILLTGATGFLGGTVAAELLGQKRWGNVLLLVRAPSLPEARQRVVKSLQRFEVGDKLLKKLSPDQIICGGLDALPAAAEDARLAQVTHVVNCAAVTSFGQNPNTWPTNVEHTLAFARKVAAFPRLERFIHVSTAMICGSTPPRVVFEDSYPAAGVRHLVGYTGSKATAETMLRKELAGKPLVIVRPSIIVGHTRLGCKPSGSIFWGFRMADALRMVTCDVDAVVDVIPVDYTARALLSIMDAAELKHPTYHISAGRDYSSSFREIGHAFARALGETRPADYRRVTYQDVAALQDQFTEIFGPGNKRSMLAAARLYGTFAGLNTTFDNQRLLAEGVEPPPPFADYLGVCVETSRTTPIAQQMMVDFE